MHTFHVLIKLSGRYVRFPTEIAITMCTFDMLIQLRGRYEIFPTEFTNQSNHLTEKRYALFSTEFTITSSPCLQFQFLIQIYTTLYTLHQPRGKRIERLE